LESVFGTLSATNRILDIDYFWKKRLDFVFWLT
jgi:hypothetical protein